jgi:hypothetical protein
MMAIKGMIEVQDSVLWPMNIKGNTNLRDDLMAMKAEQIRTLKVAGHSTTWERMKDGKDGRPVHGLKPCGSHTKNLWGDLYRERKGELVTIEEDK